MKAHGVFGETKQTFFDNTPEKTVHFAGSSRSTCLVADRPLVAIGFRPRFVSDHESAFTIEHMSNGVLWRSVASPSSSRF